jgi:hypothetical protein
MASKVIIITNKLSAIGKNFSSSIFLHKITNPILCSNNDTPKIIYITPHSTFVLQAG